MFGSYEEGPDIDRHFAGWLINRGQRFLHLGTQGACNGTSLCCRYLVSVPGACSMVPMAHA